MMRRLGPIVLAVLILPGAARGQDAASPGAGREIARELCAGCHAVEAGEGVLADPPPLPFDGAGAMAFEDIANTPGVTPAVLQVWLTSTHPTMPDILLPAGERADLVAYILSLRHQR